MKHSFSTVQLGIVAALVVALVLIVVFAMNIVTIPKDWKNPDAQGNGSGDVIDGDTNDDETPSSVVSDSGNVEVTSPDIGEIVGLPLVATGSARVFENSLSYRVRDSDGTILASGYTMANAPDIGQFGDFTIVTNYAAPIGPAGTLEVFAYSPKDGSVIDMASVAIVFPTIETMTVQTYWTTDASGENCAFVEASEHRVAKSVATAHAALSQLLAGPDTSELAKGYGTSIPAFTALKSISIEDGVATVEFSNAIEAGGSCRVTSIRSQIESTLKQFPTITTVIIRSEGKTPEESLQP